MQGVCRDKKWKAVESMDNNKSISLKAVRVYGWKRNKKGGAWKTTSKIFKRWPNSSYSQSSDGISTLVAEKWGYALDIKVG